MTDVRSRRGHHRRLGESPPHPAAQFVGAVDRGHRSGDATRGVRTDQPRRRRRRRTRSCLTPTDRRSRTANHPCEVTKGTMRALVCRPGNRCGRPRHICCSSKCLTTIESNSERITSTDFTSSSLASACSFGVRAASPAVLSALCGSGEVIRAFSSAPTCSDTLCVGATATASGSDLDRRDQPHDVPLPVAPRRQARDRHRHHRDADQHRERLPQSVVDTAEHELA